MENKLQTYKTMRYGQITMNLRKGLLEADHADHLMDEVDRDCVVLSQACENETVRAIIEAGISSTL